MSHIEKLSVSNALQIWNTFISNIPSITPFSFNPSLYNFYVDHFNWKPYYFLIKKVDEVCGVLPIVNTGKAWVSLPHFSYGGMVIKKECKLNSDSELIDFLINEVITTKLQPGYYSYNLDKFTAQKKISENKIFIRSFDNVKGGMFSKSEKVTSLLELPDSLDELSGKLSSNLNRKIRKAVNSGILIKRGGEELLDDFYKVYSRSIFELNSLNYSKNFFRDLFTCYQFGEIVCFVAYKDDKAVGSGLLASYGGFYENMFFAVDKGSRKYYVSDLLHWEMLEYSINQNKNHNETDIPGPNNNAVYSFGRSTRSSGVHNYKSHWPIKDYPLYNYTNMPNIRKHSWLSQIWGTLPYFISKPLGGYLVKHFY